MLEQLKLKWVDVLMEKVKRGSTNQKKLKKAFLIPCTQSFFVALPISDLVFHGCGIWNRRILHYSPGSALSAKHINLFHMLFIE